MELALIGDVHGNIGRYLRMLRMLERRVPPGVRSIQLGDMGLGFRGVELLPLDDGHNFLRGNHDSPDLCRAHPNYLGEFGYLEHSGVFFVSGAHSIDKMQRVIGVSWWPDEELNESQWEQLFAQYERIMPEFVVSHECPASVNERVIGRVSLSDGYSAAKSTLRSSTTCFNMQQMLEIHRPKRWVFAHYHRDWSERIKGTTFTCLSELSLRKFEL